LKKIGLFFGSFNPIHVGHLIIANYLSNHSDLDEIWLVVSPQNPFKKKSSLAKDYDRFHLAQLGIGDNPKIKASKIEFDLPQPSYTIDTLIHLKEKHPDKEFALIMGGDNLASFHKWKNFEIILRDYHIYVYQRPEYVLGELANHEHVHILDTPQMNISSSSIRKLIKEGKSYRYMVPDSVFESIEASGIYKKL